MKEVKIENKTYVTKYESIDGVIFNSKEECEKYEASAKGVLLAKFNELQVKLGSEQDIFGIGSDEYYIAVVKLITEYDVDTISLLWCLFNQYYSNDTKMVQDIRNKCVHALDTDDYLLVGRGYEYEQYDNFWVIGTLTDKLTKILNYCDPNLFLDITDNLS